MSTILGSDEVLNSFNHLFGIPKGTPFKRPEIVNAIIEHFGSIQIMKYDETNVFDQIVPKHYTVGTNFHWEYNDLSTSEEYYTINDALMGLFIETFDESIEENNKYVHELEDILNEVYQGVRQPQLDKSVDEYTTVVNENKNENKTEEVEVKVQEKEE